MSKVLVVGGDFLVEKMFEKAGWTIVDSLNDAELVQFTGGADVDPEMYGHERHRTTYSTILRDRKEAMIFNIALRNLIPMAGICRGGQFLNVMNGGKMYQDVNHHAIGGEHLAIDTDTGEAIRVTSTHHQMMIPHKDGKVVAIANIATRKERMCGKQTIAEIGGDDTEVVFYPNTMSLCFQPHPEYESKSTKEYYFECLRKHLKFA